VLFGGHVSGGVKAAPERAGAIGADALQLFVQSPRAWRFPNHDPEVLGSFADRAGEAGIKASFAHAIYLVNLATPNEEHYRKSVDTMKRTMETACAIDADGVVFHVGSHLGAGFEAGLERAAPALAEVLELCSDRTWLLVENSAGTGDTIGRSVEELAAIFDRLDHHPRLGLCLDSCHLWVSGVDVTDRKELNRVLKDVDGSIGLDRLRVLHVNDAASGLGSNRDRHANVGEGTMAEGLGQFLAHPKLQKLPALLETDGPDGHGPDAGEVTKLRELHARWRKPRAK
jgi:deoxyribonuclease IV